MPHHRQSEFLAKQVVFNKFSAPFHQRTQQLTAATKAATGLPFVAGENSEKVPVPSNLGTSERKIDDASSKMSRLLHVQQATATALQ